MADNSALQEVMQTISDIKQAVGPDGDLTGRIDVMEKDIRDGLKSLSRERVKATVGHGDADTAKVRSGPYRGLDGFDVLLSHKVLELGQMRPSTHIKPDDVKSWKAHLVEARKDIAEQEGRAMDSEFPGAGDDLTYEGLATDIWRDVHLNTAVASLFQRIAMPTNPFRIPHDLGDPTWYISTPLVAGTASTMATGASTLTAVGVKTLINWSYELDEDAVIAVLPEVRATLVRSGAEVMDDIVLNGDTSDDNSNINNHGGDGVLGLAGLDHYRAFDGILHRPLVDNTAQSVNHNAGMDDDVFNEIRSKLGKYGVRPSGTAFIMDIRTYIRSLVHENFRTLDKLGAGATILTGMLGAVEGIPIIVSEQMKVADTDGKVSAAGNGNDTGRLAIVSRSQYVVGTLRDLLIESERDIQRQETVMVASFRMAFTSRNDPSTDTATAAAYNITGI